MASSTSPSSTQYAGLKAFVDGADTVFVYNLPFSLVRAVLDELWSQEKDTRLVLTRSVLETFQNDFVALSKGVELAQTASVEFYTSAALASEDISVESHPPCILSENGAASFVPGELLSSVGNNPYPRYAGVLDSVEPVEEAIFRSSAPLFSMITEELSERFGSEVAESFCRLTEGVRHLPAGRTNPDIVTAFVFVAAKHGLLTRNLTELLTDLSITAPGTISRRKSSLVNLGYVRTSKAPTDGGRPPQKLRLREGYEETPLAELFKRLRQEQQNSNA